MAYYKKVLQPDETVKCVGILHWSIYAHAIAFCLPAAGLLGVSLGLTGQPALAALAVAAIFLALAVVSFLRSWYVRVTTEIVVTDKRIIYKAGWIVRRTEEINLSKVESVDVRQGIGGRIFNYGTVAIRGIGGSWEPLRRIAEPLTLRNAIVVG